MKPLRLVSGLLTLICSASAGDVSGHAVITKRLTKKAVSATVYNLRGAAAPSAPAEPESVTEFDRMVVFLDGGKAPAKPPVSVTIDQRALRFEPDLVVIPVGSTVQFPNSDPIFHNVFSFSRAQPFDLGYYPRGASKTVAFKRAGVVQVYCHIHSGMYAAIVVTASPWFGKPSADGGFSFDNVPAGHYKVVAWHKVAGLHQAEVDVPASGKVNVTLHIPVDVEQ